MADLKPDSLRLSLALLVLWIGATTAPATLAQSLPLQARDTAALVDKPFALELEGSAFPAQVRGELKALVEDYLREQYQEEISLTELQGPFGLHAACPLGFVTNASVSLSTRAITLTKSQGANCDGPQQCRTWAIETLPDDLDTPYDLTLTLQCSSHDALRNRARQANTPTLRSRVEDAR